MAFDLYINPVGLLYGAAAREAIEDGKAGKLAGGSIGFLNGQLLTGAPGSLEREFYSYRDLKRSKDAVVGERLHLVEQSRALPVKHKCRGPLIMGVVNVTPDSFSDGGNYLDPAEAIEHGRRLAQEGADILDIGGESTRPGAMAVSVKNEAERVLPVVKGLSNLAQPLSIDTRKPEIMQEAAESGARLLNDISGLTYQQQSLEVARDVDLPLILMHAQGDPRTMQENPQYENVVLEVFNWLAGRLEAAVEAGIKSKNLMVDPGIGFGKNLDHNLMLLANLAFFHGLGVPVVLGASRKRFIGHLAEASEAKNRTPGSIAAALSGAAQGIQIIRVHDVAETRQALRVSQAIAAV